METGLALDNSRWEDLRTRNGNATWVPGWLRQLDANPLDHKLFSDEWAALCSEGSTWSAAYAAFPHLVRIASRVRPEERFEYVVVLGLIVRDQCYGDSAGPMGLRPYLAADFQAAIGPALQLAAEVLGVARPDEQELRYGLMAVTALQGYYQLAEFIDQLDDGDVCPPYAEFLGRK
ncbi:hypothetical protein [Fimbriiglobus ruber]|nr:hypothetical protein [Fimbriiglobus ruber]